MSSPPLLVAHDQAERPSNNPHWAFEQQQQPAQQLIPDQSYLPDLDYFDPALTGSMAVTYGGNESFHGVSLPYRSETPSTQDVCTLVTKWLEAQAEKERHATHEADNERRATHEAVTLYTSMHETLKVAQSCMSANVDVMQHLTERMEVVERKLELNESEVQRLQLRMNRAHTLLVGELAKVNEDLLMRNSGGNFSKAELG
ncbi:hypothetical protein LTR08_004996 [Meristemomyces frigidus]|nr:hypothetical protein LTR08_004996 [Meristemomyces frigidus]